MNDTDEDATAERQPSRERRRLRMSRLIQYLLLQALIVAVCVLALLQSLPGPPAQFQVTAFRLTEAGIERAVTLPYFSPLRNAMNDPPRFSGQFVHPPVGPCDPQPQPLVGVEFVATSISSGGLVNGSLKPLVATLGDIVDVELDHRLRLADGGNLSGCFAQPEDDFREPLSDAAMVIDAGEPQILERAGAKPLRQLLARGDRVLAACRLPLDADALNALAAGHPDRADAILLSSGTFVDCYRFRADILDGRGDWPAATPSSAPAPMAPITRVIKPGCAMPCQTWLPHRHSKMQIRQQITSA